jgi:hypothetical protein
MEVNTMDEDEINNVVGEEVVMKDMLPFPDTD